MTALEPASCLNCRFMFNGIGVGQGLRCSHQANRGAALTPNGRTPLQKTPLPVIPSRDFVCQHHESVKPSPA